MVSSRNRLSYFSVNGIAIYILALIIPFLIVSCRIKPGNRDKEGVYSTGKKSLNLKIEELDPILQENSGIIMFRGFFWTINDSGNDPVLFAFHPVTGRVIQQVNIINARNIDWEGITQDKEHIYIGDFGNNQGYRTYLQVYKIKKSELPAGRDGGVRGELIGFRYGDRKEDESGLSRSAYDCEAFFARNDSLYLFTKNWHDETTSMYVLPSLTGSYVLYPRHVFNANGLVTAAAISKNGKVVTLLGYKDYVPFIWIFEDYTFPDIFDGTNTRLEFPSYFDLQTEGITIQHTNILYISCERSAFPPQVYWLDLEEVTRDE